MRIQMKFKYFICYRDENNYYHERTFTDCDEAFEYRLKLLDCGMKNIEMYKMSLM